MDTLDKNLLELLLENSRLSITELAKRLNVTRATVQEHIRRLERNQIIQGYTVRLHPEYAQRQVCANVLIAADQKKLSQVSRQIEQIKAVQSLHSISGQYDLCAQVQDESTETLDQQIDKIISIDGIERTQTSIYLSRKFDRS
ncbi:Lrp/AsnC family transcriptional regulator [Dasania marina]|uniref:Lrp/AsnC family transcriptional regulator n=1 Tax=Dasania marina TaxID=471499 RepID=UPI0030D86648|tara:strand:+ start:1608 stop:2036 length:429 start_codon:yes stop_codon:yes gene_type:complete